VISPAPFVEDNGRPEIFHTVDFGMPVALLS